MPIIIGSPRSGTTLLRFMLDSHPDLAIPPETGFLSLSPTLKGSGHRLRNRFFRAVVGHPKSAPAWPDFGISENLFLAELSKIEPFTIADGFRSFYRLYAARFGKSRWGDKTPLYCMDLDEIRRVLPEARFIHLIRDGRDVALSLRKMWFSPGPEIENQAEYWRNCVRKARQLGIGRSDYIEIRYEELVLNPRENLERICDFIGLSYSDVMLRYYTRSPERLGEHKGRARTDGTWLVTREQRLRQQARTMQPLDPACVFGWKRDMSRADNHRFQHVAGDLLKDLGYDM